MCAIPKQPATPPKNLPTFPHRVGGFFVCAGIAEKLPLCRQWLRFNHTGVIPSFARDGGQAGNFSRVRSSHA